MAIRVKHKKSGYSSQTAFEYISCDEAIYSLSSELEVQQHFEDGKPTGEIIGYKGWFVQKGLDPFQVKFTEKIDLPKFMSLVQFRNLQACEVRHRVYFKADGIKEVK